MINLAKTNPSVANKINAIMRIKKTDKHNLNKAKGIKNNIKSDINPNKKIKNKLYLHND